ncbi:helical backbone metal receptor [Thermovibrio sp.]
MVRVFFFFLLFSLSAFGADRVVSLSPALSELLFYLGDEGKVVGVSNFCTAKECKGKVRVGGIVNPNLEAVLSLKPDLVVCTTMTPERVCNLFKKFGIKTLRLRLVSLKDLKTAVKELSQEVGAEKKPKPLVRLLKEKAKELRPCLEGKRVVILLSLKPPIVAGRESYMGELLLAAKAKVIPEGTFLPVSYEFLVKSKADLLISFCGCLRGFRCVDLSKERELFFHLSPLLFKGLEVLRGKVCLER